MYKAVCDYEKAKQTFKTIELMAGLVQFQQCNDEGETPLVVAMKRQTVSFIDELVTWISQNEYKYVAPFEFITTISKFFPNSAEMSFVYFQNSRFSEVVLRFLFVSQSIASQMTQDENQMLEEYFSDYIRYFSAERTFTVLHSAVFRFWRRIENINLT